MKMDEPKGKQQRFITQWQGIGNLIIVDSDWNYFQYGAPQLFLPNIM